MALLRSGIEALLLLGLILACSPSQICAFSIGTTFVSSRSSSTTLFGTNRKSRRLQQNQKTGKSRSNEFYDAIKEGSDESDKTKKKGKKGKKQNKNTPSDEESSTSTGLTTTPNPTAATSETAFDDRPEVTTVIIDEDTGMERIAQGKAVMDVVTRKAVVLSPLGPMYRLAQMFPGVPPEARERYRLDSFYARSRPVRVPEIVKAFEAAVTAESADQNTVPPHPNVTDTGLDFVLANRDLLGSNFKKTLGRLKMRAQSRNELDSARRYRALWKHFFTLEDSISAPFRQTMLDAETSIGPNFGNLDVRSYVGTELYERTAAYLVLKGMVTHWEKKVLDADYFENTPQTKSNFITLLSTGDPKRYLPDPPIIFKLDEVTRVCSMARQMTAIFVNDTALFDDLPVEVRFIESALNVKGGTALRKFMVQDFCPAEGITPAALREGLRRLDAQLENMQIDPYGDLKNTVAELCEATAVGTDEDVSNNDPYGEYLYNLDKNGPGFFQTYTFSADPNSLVRFLDNARNIDASEMGNTEDVFNQLKYDAKVMWGSEDTNTEEVEDDYIPQKRSLGRPHMTGWLDWLDEDKDEDATFESDNWREIKK